MERLSPAQRLQIVQLYYENGRSVRNVYRGLRATYGPHNRPTERTIRSTIIKLETHFSLLDNARSNRPHPARSEGNIGAVAESVREHREVSIRRRSKQLGLSYSTTWRILRKDLSLKTSKDQNLLKSSIIFSKEENENKNITDNTTVEVNEQKIEETKTEENIDNKMTDEVKEAQKPKHVPPDELHISYKT